jgi:putative tryptophan/tyrosine transport system substrate-binding protein
VSAARVMGLETKVHNAATGDEINAAFATFVAEKVDALLVAGDAFYSSRRVQLVHLATRYGMPATYSQREFTDVGGLMSYGPNLADVFRQVGTYAGRLLKGAKPGELPVIQTSKFEFVINAETARLFGIIVPPRLLAAADEVIE